MTEVFCRTARYFQPHNGERIDAIRDAIAERYAGTWLEPSCSPSLLEAADRVDSTTGVQMAYLKAWAPRSYQPLELRAPALPDGPAGRGLRGDAGEAVRRPRRRSTSPTSTRPTTSTATPRTTTCGRRSWRGTHPAHYGVACKRVDLRDPDERSPFNERGPHAGALGRTA